MRGKIAVLRDGHPSGVPKDQWAQAGAQGNVITNLISGVLSPQS